MVRTTLAVCAMVLSGCAAHTMGEGGGGGGGGKGPGDTGPDPCDVKVYVRPSPHAGEVRIFVNNDPVYPRDAACNGKVTWHLMKPGYTFSPSGGIAVRGGTPPNCTPGAQDYSCIFDPQPPGTKLPYSITVIGPDGVRHSVDPSIITD